MVKGEKIKYYREKNKLTQKELTAGICSIPYLSKVENNVLVPSEEILKLLCLRLNIRVNDLLPSESQEIIIKEIKKWYEAIKHRDVQGAKEYHNKVSRSVEGTEDVEILAFFSLMSARHFLFLKDFDKAQALLMSAYSFIQYVPKHIINFFYYFQGLYEYLNGNLEKALENYLLIKDYINEPEYLFQLGLIYTRLNKTSLSIVYTEKALEEYNKNIIFYKLVDCYILLGINYNRLKEFELAKEYLFKAEKASSALRDNSNNLERIYHNLGCVFHGQNNSQEAIKYFYKALGEKNNYVGKENTIYLLARELNLINDKIDSLYWINTALSTLNAKQNIFYYLLKILQFQVEEKCLNINYQDFLLQDALPFFQTRKDLVNIENCYELLGKYFYDKKLYKNASDYYKKAFDLKNS